MLDEKIKIEIRSVEDLHKVIDRLPVYIISDIHNRIDDWLSSGGNETDNYIKQQFRYAENYLNK